MKKVAEQTGIEVADAAADTIPEDVRRNAEASVATDHGLLPTQMRSLTRKTIQNVTSKSFGVLAVDRQMKEYVSNLIVVDEKVPVDVTEQFHTVADNQTSVRVVCMENKQQERGHVDLEASTEIGQAELRFSKPVPKGSPVDVQFSLSADGLLSIHAKDLTTGAKLDLEINVASTLTADELENKKALSQAISVS